MYSYTTSKKPSKENSSVEMSDVSGFVRLSSDEQFEVLRKLRMDAAHLGGGSFTSMAAIYLSTVLVSVPLIGAVSLQPVPSWAVIAAITFGLILLAIGLWLTLDVALQQRRLARSATRLAFYEEALRKRSVAPSLGSAAWWLSRWRPDR